MDCSPPGSSVCGILQARILEWVAISYSRGFSWPRDCTRVSYIAGRFFTVWATELSYYQAYLLLDIYLHTEVGSHSLFQGIFLIQGSNPGLLHCKQITVGWGSLKDPLSMVFSVYSPSKNTGVGCHSVLQRIFLAQRSNLGLPRCRWILYHLSHLCSLVPSTKNLLNVNGVRVVLSTTNIIKNKNRQCTYLMKQWSVHGEGRDNKFL